MDVSELLDPTQLPDTLLREVAVPSDARLTIQWHLPMDRFEAAVAALGMPTAQVKEHRNEDGSLWFKSIAYKLSEDTGLIMFGRVDSQSSAIINGMV